MLSQFYLSLYIHQMKKILVLIIVLFTAIVTMAYLYFSELKPGKKNDEDALYAVAPGASVIFSFQNDKSILDILSSQTSLSEILGKEKSIQIKSLYQYLLNKPAISTALDKQAVYISLFPGKNNDIDLLYSTQFNTGINTLQLLNILKSSGIKTDSVEELTRLTLPDSSIFFLAVKEHVILLSNSEGLVQTVASASINKTNKFAEYISATSKIAKNSMAEVYIDFNNLPKLMKTLISGNLSGNLSFFNHTNAFASLVYNYSADKILLNGITTLNDTKSYYQLYKSHQAQKITINSILPQNTANYTVYAIGDYLIWKKKLDAWFADQHQRKRLETLLNDIKNKYHLDAEQIFPKYFKNQLITFQLSTGENIGAITLTNGEKFEQLLLDLSTADISEDIKLLKESDLLYAYFGDPFKKFRKPYYVVIDNYMVFANNSSTVQSFLNNYRNDRLLINNPDYINSVNQLPNTSGITFFMDLKNSSDLLLRNVHLPYYRYIMDKEGLKTYSSFICQLSGEKDKFQTNVLLNKKAVTSEIDSLITYRDSLEIRP